jgi:hypothetical protein
MRHFTLLTSVPLMFILFYPTLAQAADSSSQENSSSSLYLIAAAFIGLCFALPVFWKAAKTFLKNRSQKAESGKKTDTLA